MQQNQIPLSASLESSFQRTVHGIMPTTPTSSPVSEKPFHYTYLKEFRVEQCKAFLQHKCNQHRPFTCFHWHFMNQRRRRPVKRREGTFNYSPDVYCTFYDETTGICPNSDECPYLHRTAGDTERRYHLRYYKTSTCVYETDSRGYCVKNGPHCAFAHGPNDLRPPVYDVRELQGVGCVEDEEGRLVSTLVGSLEKERGVLVDDPRWQESSFVLTYYKTEPCKRPPRLCRQGYACPFYHNNKDRRRTPKKFKYRSTPCPNVKLNDEWGDPTNCEQGDICSYCHTRTEQQFHPEIYKSTKCNDVQQTGYCPRGPFCAFAHDEKELTSPRDLTDAPMMSTPSSSPIVTTPGVLDGHQLYTQPSSQQPLSSSLQYPSYHQTTSLLKGPLFSPSSSSSSSTAVPPSVSSSSYSPPFTKSLPQPISRMDRMGSIASEGFQRAPGAEVKCRSHEDDSQLHMILRKQFQVIDSDVTLDDNEKTKRKQMLRLTLETVGAGMSPEATFQSHSLPSSVTDTLEAVVGGGLDDLTLEDIDSTNLTDEQLPAEMYVTSGGSILGQSPVAQSFMQSFSSSGQGPSSSSSYPYSTPLGPLSPFSGTTSSSTGPFQHVQMVGPGVGFGHTSPLPCSSSPAFFYTTQSSSQQQHQQLHYPIGSSTRTPPSPTKPSAMMQAAIGSPIDKSEMAALRDELKQSQTHLIKWHESWKQAKQACDAWKKEAEETSTKSRVERERIEELEQALREAENKMRIVQAQGPIRALAENAELARLPMSNLEQIEQLLRRDLERVSLSIQHRLAHLCTKCKEIPRCVLAKPCNHCTLCEKCFEWMGSDPKCPYCNELITSRTIVSPY